jgi:sugar lactone lactonase YvrE
MRRLKAELYHRSECLLGETPVWADGTLFWTDILGKALLAKPEGSGPVQNYRLPYEMGSFALWREDRIVLATDQGFHCFDLQTRALEAWANPEPSIPGNRFNDGKCDPRGRFVAGTINRAGRPLAAL